MIDVDLNHFNKLTLFSQWKSWEISVLTAPYKHYKSQICTCRDWWQKLTLGFLPCDFRRLCLDLLLQCGCSVHNGLYPISLTPGVRILAPVHVGALLTSCGWPGPSVSRINIISATMESLREFTQNSIHIKR